MKQKLVKVKGEKDKSIILVGDFNTHLSVTERKSRPKKTSKDIDFNNTINLIALFTFIDYYTQLGQIKTSFQMHMEYSPS